VGRAARKVKWAQRYGYRIRSVAVSPDGEAVASGHFDNRARLTNAEDGAVVATLAGHSGGVNSVVFSPDEVARHRRLDTTVRSGTSRSRSWSDIAGHRAEVYWTPFDRRNEIASGSRDATAACGL